MKFKLIILFSAIFNFIVLSTSQCGINSSKPTTKKIGVYSFKAEIAKNRFHNINRNFLKAAKNGNIFALNNALLEGADINYADENGDTALMLASKNSQINIVDVLLKLNVDINVINKYGKTAIAIATERPSIDIINLLLDQKANIPLEEHEVLTQVLSSRPKSVNFLSLNTI